MITQSLLSKQLSSRVYEVGAVRDGPVPVRSSQFANCKDQANRGT